MSPGRRAGAWLALALVLTACAGEAADPASVAPPRPEGAAGGATGDGPVTGPGPAVDPAVAGGLAVGAPLEDGDAGGAPPRLAPPRPAPPPALDGPALIELVASLPAPRGPGSEGHAATAGVLAAWLEPLGLTLRRQPFAWAGRPDGRPENLELRLPGRDPEAPLWVVCAHYDTVAWSPGADDNGSGVVALMALARRLPSLGLSAEVALVWFDEEEAGFVGSRAWLAALPPDDRQRLAGVINLETVGYTDRRPGSQRLPPGARLLLDPGDVGDFVLLLANQASAELAADVAAGLAAEQGSSFRVESFAGLPGQGWLLPDSRRSDHATFWDAGVPAVMLTDTANFRNPHYHRGGDLPGTLDGPFLAALVRGVERALILLSEG